ncbi:MAG: hypothetical protein HYZ14_00590 [Bacteroidetes bacterium]|nr:hypothetical protein [Bacteroidota bacterium]
MRKYKVNRTATQKVPSQETIEKYKDFSRLSHAYDHYTKRPKKPIYKDKRMFLFILLIALMAYLLSESFADEKEDTGKDSVEESR